MLKATKAQIESVLKIKCTWIVTEFISVTTSMELEFKINQIFIRLHANINTSPMLNLSEEFS